MENLVVLDCEVYPNYFLIAFKSLEKKTVVEVEIIGKSSSFTEQQIKKVNKIMSNYTTFGYNSRNYDLPIILYALKKATCDQIYSMSKHIIENGSIQWQTLDYFNLSLIKKFKHFDIQEPAPAVKISLKLYGARMHSKRLQDLPYDPHTPLLDDQINLLRRYCVNDLDTTIDLYESIKPRIQLRSDMSKQYDQDLMSKSDAQIAEAVIKSEINKKTPMRLKAQKLSQNVTFTYKTPKFIKFKTQPLNDLLKLIQKVEFGVDKNGSLTQPEELKKLKLNLGKSIYKIGRGGLHSTESSQIVEPNDNEMLIDKDVASYYPAIIINLGLSPETVENYFLDIYKGIVDQRLEAKRNGNKIVNESLKIVINGTFGKFGSSYSFLYSPNLLLTTTLTGQLSLLMLIESLELEGIQVVSANTDGFVSLINKSQYKRYSELCDQWEKGTKFILEETQYKALYSRDVNNYLAVKTDNTSKGKGIFAINSLAKNPQADICIQAVTDLIINNVPLKKTLTSCKDLRKFLTVRTVTGGAVWRDNYLGKVVRWIYSTDGDVITYQKNGNKVAKSDGSRPIMELVDELPKDIDYEKYLFECEDILKNLGYFDL